MELPTKVKTAIEDYQQALQEMDKVMGVGEARMDDLQVTSDTVHEKLMVMRETLMQYMNDLSFMAFNGCMCNQYLWNDSFQPEPCAFCQSYARINDTGEKTT